MKASLFLSCALAFTACCWTGTATAQTPAKPLFPGAEYLDGCLADLPPTYSEQDTIRYLTAAQALGNVELIYLVADKHGSNATYKRMYLDGMMYWNQEGNNEYLIFYVSPQDHKKKHGSRHGMTPEFTPNMRFYLAQCFDEQLAAHPELKRVLKKKH